MLIEERRQKILKYIQKNGRATVAELSGYIYASEPTVRRDLTAMEKAGQIKKVYGGAMADREIPMDVRLKDALRAKELMAQKACKHVKDGDVILLDGSSSAMAMVKYLTHFKELIVITSGAKTAVALAEAGIRTFCTGGMMITRSFSFVGQPAQDFIMGINADVLFFSCHGMSEDGRATDLSMEEVNLRRVMMRHANRKILLCDKSKYGKMYFYTLCTADDVDAVISE